MIKTFNTAHLVPRDPAYFKHLIEVKEGPVQIRYSMGCDVNYTVINKIICQ